MSGIGDGSRPKATECDPSHCCVARATPLSSCNEIVPFKQETDMNEDTHERELSMDELDLVSGAGAIAPLTPSTRLLAREAALGRQGIVDDSV